MDVYETIKSTVKSADSKKLEKLGKLLEDNPKYCNIAMKYAAMEGEFPIMKFLLKKGANDYDYDYFLTLAAERGHLPILQLLIDNGAKNYNWALQYAALKGHVDIVQLLLHKGANDYNASNHTKNQEIIDLIEIYKNGKIKL